MRIFGTHVPVSGWTLAVLGAGLAVSLLLWQPVVRRWNWRPWPALGLLLSLATVLALTMTPDGDRASRGLSGCVPGSWDALWFQAFNTGGGIGGNLFNVLLLFPLGLSTVLASRRLWPALLGAAGLPVVVELVQSVLPGRNCAVSDLLTNGAGALLGAAVGWVALRAAAPSAGGAALG